MVAYPFEPRTAINVEGELSPIGTGAVYALDDTTFSTPLVARDFAGAVLPSVSVSALGVTQFFTVEDHGAVWWKSGDLPPILLVSYKGYADAAEQSRVAAAEASDAATSLAELVTNSEDATVASLISMPDSETVEALTMNYRATGVLRSVMGRDLRMIAGAIRNNGGPGYWQPISDAGHEPVNVASVSTTSNAIVINFPTDLAVSRIVSFVVGPDETLATAGVIAGASVALDKATIYLRGTTAYSDFVSYDTGSGTWSSAGGVFDLAWNAAGHLVCTHPTLPAGADVFDVSVTGRGGAIASSHGATATTALVRWHDYAGALLTTPGANHRAFVRHGTSGPLNPQQVDTTVYPGSNLWFVGVVEV